MNEQNNSRQTYPRNSAIIWKIAITAIITAFIVGGGTYWWHKSGLEKIRNEASKTQETLQQQIKELQTELTQLQQKIEITDHFLKIHTLDPNTYEGKIDFYVAIPQDLSLFAKLKLLADKLSRLKFRGLPINVLKIENGDTKKIAIVELEEKEGHYFPSSWRGNYFQGSTGGTVTTATLVETFLQRDYKGDWIDGVEFYYEGKPIVAGDWDHIGLSGTIYRQEKQQ